MNKILHTGNMKIFKALMLVISMVAVFNSSNAVSNSEELRNSISVVHLVKCYPNPAISFVNFEFPATYLSQKYTVGIYSFSGKKMLESNVNAPKMTFNFNGNFFRGIYIYQLKDNAGRIVETGKFQVVQ